MSTRLFAAITIVSLSAAPVMAKESSITISKDKLTPTGAIGQMVPVMKYDGKALVGDEEVSSQVYTRKIDQLIPTMTMEGDK